MKLFRTGSVALVEDCQRFLNFLPASYQLDVLQKYKALENRICSLFGQEADRQLEIFALRITCQAVVLHLK